MNSFEADAVTPRPQVQMAATPEEDALAREGLWEDLVTLLLQRAEGTGLPEESAACLERAAATYESRLRQPDKAFVVWQAALAQDPTSKAATQALERLAPALGAADRLLTDTEALLDGIADARARATLLVTLARWQQRFANNARAAEALLDEALLTTPAALGVVQALADLVRARGDRRRLTEVCGRLLALDPQHAQARSLAGELSDAEAATLLEQVDEHVAARRLPEATDLLHLLAARAQGHERSRYLVTIGKILQSRLGDDAGAVAAFNQALDAEPDDLQTFERLFKVLAGRKAWSEAETNLMRMIGRLSPDNASHRGALAALWRKLGDVYRVGLHDDDAAADAYRRSVRLVPEDDRARRLLDEMSGRNVRRP